MKLSTKITTSKVFVTSFTNHVTQIKMNHSFYFYSSNNVVAESSIDRLACGLGGKIVLPHIISNIPAMLSNTAEWQYR